MAFGGSKDGTSPARRKSNTNTATARDDGLVYSGRFAGGIRDDIARRLPWYSSDWTDGFKGGIKVFTASLYMFAACLAPGIAFGAYFDQVSGGETGVVEYLITQGVSGVIFAAFSGQPLIILRPTGPITVFISQLYAITQPMGLPYLAVMSWVGIFVGLYMIIIAVTDGCAAIRFCSRFTQDLFGCFVSVIFISLGIGNIVDKFTKKQDVFSATHQLILTAATLYLALKLAGFNKAKLFNGKIREFIADFAVPLSVILMTIVSNLLDVKVEPLPVPPDFEPTKMGRSWIVDICPAEACGACVGVGAIAAIPLVLLFFIDQNVTSLLTQHPDHKLKKGAAFHYNFFILGCFNIIFPLFGCPYVTGSLPHSPQFAKALASTEVVRDGAHEKTVVKGVCENRVAPLLVNALVIACLPVIGMLKYIPTAVICDGLFLFMGLSGLPGNQLFERFVLIFTEEALYPPLHFTQKEVPRRNMHVFTFFQGAFVAILFAVSKSPIALAFPVFLVSSIPVRMLLPKITGGFLTKDMVETLDHAKKEESKQELVEPEVIGSPHQDAKEEDRFGASAKEAQESQITVTVDSADEAEKPQKAEPRSPVIEGEPKKRYGGSSPTFMCCPVGLNGATRLSE